MYKVDQKNQNLYTSLALLWLMIQDRTSFSVTMDEFEGEEYLEPYLIWLLSKGYIQEAKAKDESIRYIASEKGRKVIENYVAKYREYLRDFDIFCAVDLANGKFAYTSINDYDFDDPDQSEAWDVFCNDKRFEDMTIAVTLFKGLDPIEIQFIKSMNEGSFFKEEDQYWNLSVGTAFKEIEAIVNSNLKPADLSDDEAESKTIMEKLIRAGLEEAKRLRAEELAAEKAYEEEMKAYREQQRAEAETVVTTTTTIVEEEEDDYFDYGLFVPVVVVDPWPIEVYVDDPFYVSPVWGVHYDDDWFWD